ncbi:hypothetical protein C8R46DRAFT_105236 [Mycena filopes]|nr:hypothetical protein C8R46DRAFT_105236 [Mycena filopes]
MRLCALMSGVRLAAQSLILDREKLKLTTLSIILLAMNKAQTAGWTTLLTPTQFAYKTRVTGQEIDLNSHLLDPLLSSGALDYCISNTTNLPSFIVGQTESGSAAASSHWGFPQSLTLMDWVYIPSTAGIIPLTSDPQSGTWFDGKTTTLAPAISQSTSPRSALSANVTMVQQGFSADVSCAFKDLTNNTTPSLNVLDTQVGDPNNQTNTIFLRQMSSNCVSPSTTDILNTTSVYLTETPNSGSFSMVACIGAEGTYDVIFSGGGDLYGFLNTTVCNVKPIITTVSVDYDDDLIETTTLPTQGTSALGDPAGVSAVIALYNLLSFAQAPETSVVGDQLKALVLDNDALPEGQVILESLENYVRGVTEYTGTVFKACVSSKNGFVFADGLPSNMTVTSSGKLDSQYMGWTITLSSSWVLIPQVVIAFATIWVILGAVAVEGGNVKDDPFDPSNTMHLISASAAGGLRDVVAGTTDEAIKDAESIGVVLQKHEGKGWALDRR